jgi:hypothetical protein
MSNVSDHKSRIAIAPRSAIYSDVHRDVCMTTMVGRFELIEDTRISMLFAHPTSEFFGALPHSKDGRSP